MLILKAIVAFTPLALVIIAHRVTIINKRKKSTTMNYSGRNHKVLTCEKEVRKKLSDGDTAIVESVHLCESVVHSMRKTGNLILINSIEIDGATLLALKLGPNVYTRYAVM